MIYLDNSATSFYKPPCVVAGVADALKYASGNPGRSGHAQSLKAANIIYCARKNLASYLGCANADNCIFTAGCTHALNLAILGSAKTGHIITTALEHNSVLRPIHYLKEVYGVKVTVLPPDDKGVITARSIEQNIRSDTYLIAVNHISNVTGAINDVAAIGRIAKKHNITFLVDGAQSAGHIPVDMTEFNIDMLSVAPHKGLNAPQGVGALLLSDNVRLRPIIFGGTGIDSTSFSQGETYPDSFESGTLPTPAIAGLKSAIEYSVSNDATKAKQLETLSALLFDKLSCIDGVKVYSRPEFKTGVVSFNIKTCASAEIAGLLDKNYNICVRGGLHCAPLAHEYLGTLAGGAVRASIGIDTTAQDIQVFACAVKELCKSI